MSEIHETDGDCSCENCTMIDCLWGDPLLNTWEKKFIVSLSDHGWLTHYTEKQIAKLHHIYHKILRLRKIEKTGR